MFGLRLIKTTIFLLISLKSIASLKPVLPNSLVSVYDSARLMINKQNYTAAFDYINKIKYANDVKQNLYIQAASELLEGGIYRSLQFYDKAEIHYLASRDLFEKTNQKAMTCLVTYILGSVIEAAKADPVKQYNYFKEALDLAYELQDTIRIVASLDAIGCSLSRMKEYDRAIEYSKKADTIMNITTLAILDPNIYTNIAEFYLKKGDYHNAHTYITKALKLYGKRDDSNFINDAFRIAGVIHLKLGIRKKGCIISTKL